MVSIRRMYVYVVAAISLVAASSALVALLQALIPPTAFEVPVILTATLIAVVVIALPFYLGHWLWAQRLAARDASERASLVRRIYLYGLLTYFLAVLVNAARELVDAVLAVAFNVRSLDVPFRFDVPLTAESAINAAIAMIVVLPVWLYHELVVRGDARVVPDAEHAATVRRLYIFGFALLGLVLTALGVSQVLRYVLYLFGPAGTDAPLLGDLLANVARIVVGVPLWVVFWMWAERLAAKDETESEAGIRKLYLYVVVFGAAATAVFFATSVFAGILMGLFGVPTSGDIRDALSVIVVAVLVWGFHWFVLRQETELTQETERQAGLRRLYWYLVAAIGLGALLIGLGGVLNVVINAAANGMSNSLKQQLAWYLAAIVAGFPVWFLPWFRAERLARRKNEVGAAEQRSLIRKMYLYFYLLVATLTLLGCAIYVVARVVSIGMGEGSSTLVSDIALALGFAVIAAVVWVYHGMVLRSDSARFQADQIARRADFSIAILGIGEDSFRTTLLSEFNRTLPGLTILEITKAENGQANEALAGAKVVIGDWSILAGNDVQSTAVRASPARKLVVPMPLEQGEWVGVDVQDRQALAREAVNTVKRMVEGETKRTRRGMHPAYIVVLALIGLCMLYAIITTVIMPLLYRF